MPTYITLARFTRQGLEHIKESPTRLEAVKKNFQVKGGRVKAFYLLLGQYDGVVIYEAPNDETVAELMELGMTECFTVNWRAVSKLLRR